MDIRATFAGMACALIGVGLYAGFVATDLADPGLEAAVGAALAVTFCVSFLVGGRRFGFLAIPLLMLTIYFGVLIYFTTWAAKCPDCAYDHDTNRWPGIMLPLIMYGFALVMALSVSFAGTAAGHLASRTNSRAAAE
jgi:hypothetical protein